MRHAARGSTPTRDYTKGIAIPHPDYDDFAAFPVTFDVGVVELDDRAGPDLRRAGAARHRRDAGRRTARTGTARWSRPSATASSRSSHIRIDVDTRYKSTSRIVELNGNASKGGNLHTLNNPSAIGGRGGSCFGDSGGPVFVNNTNQVVAVVSCGNSGTCHGADYSWRVDTLDSYEFIGSVSWAS